MSQVGSKKLHGVVEESLHVVHIMTVFCTEHNLRAYTVVEITCEMYMHKLCKSTPTFSSTLETNYTNINIRVLKFFGDIQHLKCCQLG